MSHTSSVSLPPPEYTLVDTEHLADRQADSDELAFSSLDDARGTIAGGMMAALLEDGWKTVVDDISVGHEPRAKDSVRHRLGLWAKRSLSKASKNISWKMSKEV